jgi:hypothetical protein
MAEQLAGLLVAGAKLDGVEQSHRDVDRNLGFTASAEFDQRVRT